jgi:hypothetical protein
MNLGSADLRVDSENHLIPRRLGEIITVIHFRQNEFKELKTGSD